MKERLSNKEVTAIINEIELEFDVNTLTFRDVNFWPLFRWHIILTLWSPESKSSASISKASKVSKSKKAFGLLADIKNYYKKKRILKDSGLLPINRKTDYIFIAENVERKEVVNNKKIHPFANSLNQFINENSYQIFEYNYAPDSSYYGDFKVIDHLFNKVRIKEKLLELIRGKSIPKIHNYKAFISFLITKNIRLSASEKYFESYFEHIFRLSKEFEGLFSKLKTKDVFFTVYFKNVNFAVSLACRKLGIKSIEIQHGQQGLYNPQNNGFARVPENGYELLPSHFWVWGKNAAEYKKDLCSSKYHTCVVGGNPWLNSWLNSDQFDPLMNIDIQSDKPQILIALQPVENPFTDFLLEVIAKTKNDYLWRVRLHPVMKNRKEEVSNILNAINANFEIEQSTGLPLYSILKNCKFVITMWSTVAYESLYFNAKPIIIHENGKEIMADYIEKGIFDYAVNAEDLLTCISKVPNIYAEKPSFIETNIQIIKDNLKPVLN